MKLYQAMVMTLALVAGVQAAENYDQTLKAAANRYAERTRQAAEELNGARERIAAEKAPLLRRMRAAEDRIIAAESETTRWQTQQDNAADERRRLLRDFDALRKTSGYITTLAHDSLKAAVDGLAPGEEQGWGERLEALRGKLADASGAPDSRAAVDAMAELLDRTRQQLGGYAAPGRATADADNQVLDGTFAFVGPETFYRSRDGARIGAVRPRSGATYPILYALADWKPAEAAAFFAGEPAEIVADASGGKALRLREISGSFADHVRKGGLVAYAIIVVGLFALALALKKIHDLRQMAVSDAAAVRIFLGRIADGATSEAQAGLGALGVTTRELFAAGLQHLHEPKALLEERLQAVLLGQRLHYERRLPLLAVIATAAPLMGLLGTVMGMVKTFALITVFGTGNAAKLSSGISEVLVATELGLIVAIPALVAHGFIAHRLQRNLAFLERQALEFVTAVEVARTRGRAPAGKESVAA